MIKKLLATSSIGLILAACGAHDPSIALLETSASTKVQGSVQTQAVQMVIVADRTSSMQTVNNKLIENIPSFVNKISTNNVEVFCTDASNTSPDNDIQISFKTKGLSEKALESKIKNCLDYESNLKSAADRGNTDERGLESALNAWKKIESTNKLNKEAIKVTLIATNEDDCSREGDKDECDSLNITQIESGRKGYLGLSHLDKTIDVAAEFKNYSASGKHIFAPIIITDDAKTTGSCTARALEAAKSECSKVGTCTRDNAIANGLDPEDANDESLPDAHRKKVFEANALRILSVGQRYQKVAELLGQTPYCIMDGFDDIFNGIAEEIITIEGEPVIQLNRKPENIKDVKVIVTRTLSEKVSASNSSLISIDPQYQWKPGKKKGTMMRILSPEEVEYDAENKTIKYKEPFVRALGDDIRTNDYIPAEFDKRVNN